MNKVYIVYAYYDDIDYEVRAFLYKDKALEFLEQCRNWLIENKDNEHYPKNPYDNNFVWADLDLLVYDIYELDLDDIPFEKKISREGWTFNEGCQTWFYGKKNDGCGVYGQLDKWEATVVNSGNDMIIGLGPYTTVEEAMIESEKYWNERTSEV